MAWEDVARPLLWIFLIEYACEYCSFMQDYQLHHGLLSLQQMSGIEATFLLGETTHSAVYLNKKRIESEMVVEAWKDTCLLIIDEASFAGKIQFRKLHQNLQQLKQQMHLLYGGLNLIFDSDMRQ